MWKYLNSESTSVKNKVTLPNEELADKLGMIGTRQV
jgi:hypothetical protein